jgi:muramoyltetrapeptide carboxypeptidase
MPHIALIAPSSTIPEEDVILTQHYLENLGFEVTVPDDLSGEDLLCANSDEKRLFHLQNALNDSAVDVIWLLRGGYGLTRLIPDLLQMKRPEKEKLFIGFSDGTVLHLFLNQFWAWSSLHGAGANQLAKQTLGSQTIQTTLQAVKKGLSNCPLPLLHPLNQPAQKMKALQGVVTGGNLCILTCSLGTDWQINPAGRILFLEDIDERGYRIDRMLNHLDQAHVLEGVKAIIFGDFTRGFEEDGTSKILPVIHRFAESTHLPVFRVEGCGHEKENFPLPFNVEVRFEVVRG